MNLPCLLRWTDWQISLLALRNDPAVETKIHDLESLKYETPSNSLIVLTGSTELGNSRLFT